MSPRRAVAHVFLALLTAAIPLTAQHAEARSGNVVLIGRDRSVRLLTTTGLDSDPDFSEKRALVVYVHRKAPPPPMGEGEIEPVDNTELWTVNTMGPPAPKPLFTGLVASGAKSMGSFFRPAGRPAAGASTSCPASL
jgi:hypothetical protein